jgi:hypothetical protein
VEEGGATVFSNGESDIFHTDCGAPIDTMGRFCSDARVKSLFPLVLVAALALSACDTLTNRRSLYTIQKVHGPYTRQLEEGTWGHPKTVSEEWAEQERAKKAPKLIPGEKKHSPSDAPSTLPPTPETPLPTNY